MRERERGGPQWPGPGAREKGGEERDGEEAEREMCGQLRGGNAEARESFAE